MVRISERVPQLTDDVMVTITFPSTTEEWADELLEPEFDVKREKRSGKLIVSKIVSGNTDAVAVSTNVLHDVQDLLLEGDVNPMNFELTARSMVTAPIPSKLKTRKPQAGKKHPKKLHKGTKVKKKT